MRNFTFLSTDDDSSEEEPAELLGSSDNYVPSEVPEDSDSTDNDEGNVSNKSPPIPFIDDALSRNLDDIRFNGSSEKVTDDSNVNERMLYASLSVNVKKTEDKRKKTYDKVEYCPVCLKPGKKISRHLLQLHPKHPEVVTILETKEKSKQRSQLLRNFICKGNQRKNASNIRAGKGTLVTKRRPVVDKKPVSADAYAPCPFCFNWLKKTYLYRHKKNCPVLKKNDESTKNTVEALRHIRSQAAFLVPCSQDVDEGLRRNVLELMKDDNALSVIKNDEAILEYGRKMYDMTGNVNESASTRHYIGQKMREMARFLMAGRKVTGSDHRTLLSFLKPSATPSVIQTLKNIGEYNEEEQVFKTPTAVTKIAQGIRKIVVTYKAIALENGDEVMKNQLEAFVITFNNRIEPLTRASHRTLQNRKYNKPLRIPFAEDIRALNIFLQGEIQQLLQIALPEPEHLRSLQKSTLCLIFVFNRRRTAEVGRITVGNVEETKEGDLNQDIVGHLTSFEQKLARTLTRIEVRGKRGRPVPILLTPLMKTSCQVLCSAVNRQIMEVCDNNFLFGIRNTTSSTYRGCDVLREYSEKCGAKEPSLLRGTKLRKQLAIMTQLVNLKDNELDIVANFLGHDIRVHREFYRLPNSSLQLAKVGKMITSKEKGIVLSSNFNIEDDCYLSEEENGNLEEEEIEQKVDKECAPNIEKDESLNEENRPILERNRKKDKDEDTNKSGQNKGKRKGFVEDNAIPTKKRSLQKQKQIRVPWSTRELQILLKYFQNYKNVQFLPHKKDFLKCMDENQSLFSSRTWQNLKDRLRHYQKFGK